MKRVLLVDDNIIFRELLENLIMSLGYKTIAVGDGQAAINFFQSGGTADAVITDRRMPRMGGEELTRWVKRNLQIPVVFISGDDPQDFYTVARAAGADEVLSKTEIVVGLPAILHSLIGPANPLGL